MCVLDINFYMMLTWIGIYMRVIIQVKIEDIRMPQNTYFLTPLVLKSSPPPVDRHCVCVIVGAALGAVCPARAAARRVLGLLVRPFRLDI